MVIAHLITTLECGGAENQLQQLVLASGKDVRHIVISLAPGGLIASELKEVGVEVHSIGMSRGGWSPLGLIRLIRLLRRLKPDVLHCWLYHACLLGLFATRVVHVDGLIWALRSANPGFRAYSMPTRAIIRLCARLSAVPDVIIVNSETGKSVHEQWGYRTDKIKVIVNGTDVERFAPDPKARVLVREGLGITHDVVLVGLIARYHPMKDHATFLRAASLVHQQFPHAHFLLAGEGMTAGNWELSQLIHKNELLSVVHLLGSRRDIPKLTAALDVACLSSWSESFPNVVLEAMSCAVPCAATNVGDAASIIGDEGRIVPAGDAPGLAAAIIELIVIPPAQRAAMGQRARDRVLARFSLQQFVNAWRCIYRNVA